jgi:uncharacterized RDD family membrane protein YckC
MSDSNRIGFGSRFGAYLIDIVLAMVIGFVLGAVGGSALLGIFGGAEGGELGAMLGASFGAIAGAMAGIPLAFLIFMLMDAFMGQTPGKMILGIKNKSEGGSAASSSSLLIRALLKYSGTVLSVLAAITGVSLFGTLGSIAGLAIFVGCFFVLGAKKQSFHDMISKTAVFKK